MGSFSTASFPLGKSIDAADEAYAEYQKQLGVEIEERDGKRYRLVQAASADGVTGRKKVYTFTGASEADNTVDIAGDAETPCGVQRSDQESLGVGDLFWLQIGGLATVVDSGAGVTADDLVDAAAAGEVTTIADETAVSHKSIVGRAIATAVADADVTVRLRGGL